jgi:1-hydroxycarotenoid 3,4-desaturase
MWSALSGYFRTPELRQLFGRYATYTGSSPFEAPATLNLIAHVESQGVWRVTGGMSALARALEDLARGLGVELVFGADIASIDVRSGRVAGVVTRDGSRFPAHAVIANTDVSALGRLLGGSSRAPRATPPKERSLSAVTWACAGTASGFPLLHHNVFFSDDCTGEFHALFTERRMPATPTVYVCAQGLGRFFTIINAPATGDEPSRWNETEQRRCEEATSMALERAGLSIRATASEWTTPRDFEARFPTSGGALYGPAARGALSSFSREGARTKIRGLYLAGGSVHPGPGLPMVSLSGQLAASCVREDLASIAPSRAVVTSGSTSTG